MSNRFFSIPGMSPSGGEGRMNSRAVDNVPLEKLQERHPAFYKNRPEHPQSVMDVGDRIRIHGDEAEVLHEERQADGSVDVTLRRSVQGNSGTYVSRFSPDENRKLSVSKLKRTFD